MRNPFKRKIESSPSVGELGGILPFQSLLTTRHLVPDPNGNIIASDGVRCHEVIEDRRQATKCVTTAFVYCLVDKLQNLGSLNFENFYYHGSGTGTVAENIADTALGTQVDRTAGTVPGTGQGEGGSGNIYKSVALVTYGSSYAITEHGLFNQATTGGTLMDRSKFDPVNVTNGEKIEFTYQLTVNAGS